jgi:uncharacterized protein YjcR
VAGQEKTNREKALEIYLAHDGEITPAEIARQLGEKPGTVRSWKNRDNWDKALQEKRCNTSGERCNATEGEPRKRGAPKGNQNALMNIGGGAPKGNQNAKGHGAPKGNKNALKTGEHETINFEGLDDDEKEKFNNMPGCPMEHALAEIRLLTIREDRMLKRIKEIKDGLSENQKKVIYELTEQQHAVPFKDHVTGETIFAEMSMRGMVAVEMHEVIVPILDKLLKHEEALTRVQAQKQRALKMLLDKENDDKRIQQADKKIEQTNRRLDLMEYQIKGDPDDEGDDDSGDDLGW